MNKSNIKYFLIVCFGFLFFILGVLLLIAGAYSNKEVVIYIGLGLVILGAILYTILFVLVMIKYFKGRKKQE